MYAFIVRLLNEQLIFLVITICFICSPAIAEKRLYTYDNLNRLIRVDYENGTFIEYTYDAAGNRLIKSENAVSISGKITDITGNPLPDICVNVFANRCGNHVGTYFTDNNGIYFMNLSAGTYYLSTDVSCSGNNPPSYYVDMHWTSAGGALDCMSAEPVTVIDGQTTNSVDFILFKGGAVSGIIYHEDGVTPITGEADLGVEFYIGNPCNNPTLISYTPIDTITGQYISSNLPAGDYYLRTYTNATIYRMEWWADPESQVDCSAAQAVSVIPGQIATNRNFQLVMEIDSDNDGLYDYVENAACTDPNDADTDDDGILDGVEDANHNGIVDLGETSPCLADTDGDGIQDGTEMGYTFAMIGPDTDTTVFIPDLDTSSTTNPIEPDTDHDGILDGMEDANRNGRVDAGETDPLNSRNTLGSSFYVIKAKNGKTIIIHVK